MRELIDSKLRSLSRDEEKQILRLLYGLSGNEALSSSDVSKITGFPPLEIKRLEIQSLTKIRTMLSEH